MSDSSATGQSARCTDCGAPGVTGTDDVLPDPLGDERRQRRHEPGQHVERLVQGRERRGVAVPEAAARAADVPVGHVVDERRDARTGRCVSKCLERRCDVAGQPCGARTAATGRAPRARRPAAPRRRRASSPPCRHTARGRPWCSSTSAAPCGRSPDSAVWPMRRGDHGEPEHAMNQRNASAPCSSISGIGSRMLPRCLLIFLPSSARMWPRHDDVLVGALVEHQRADRHQRVEPAAGLVDRLADVLRGIGLVELLLGALDVRVAPLRERHRAGVEPRVDDLGHPSVGA